MSFGLQIAQVIGPLCNKIKEVKGQVLEEKNQLAQKDKIIINKDKMLVQQKQSINEMTR